MSLLQSKSFPPSLLCFSLVTFPYEESARVSYRWQIHRHASGSGLGLGLGPRPLQEEYDFDEITPLLSSCKRLQSREPSEEGILLDCCLSSICEDLCRRVFALWMCVLRVMGLCQRWCQRGPCIADHGLWCFSRATRLGILRSPSIFVPGSTLVMWPFLVSFFSNWRTRLLGRSLFAASIPGQTWKMWSRHSKAPLAVFAKNFDVIFQSIKQKLILIGLGLCHHCRDSIDWHPFSELQYSESSTLQTTAWKKATSVTLGRRSHCRTADLTLVSRPLRDFNEILLQGNARDLVLDGTWV